MNDDLTMLRIADGEPPAELHTRPLRFVEPVRFDWREALRDWFGLSVVALLVALAVLA